MLRRLELHRGEVAIPAPAWAEIRFGWARSPPGRKRIAIGAALLGWREGPPPILPCERRAAQWHSDGRARLGARGLLRPFIDGQIAAIHDLVLVTRNARGFKPFRGVTAVDWSRK